MSNRLRSSAPSRSTQARAPDRDSLAASLQRFGLERDRMRAALAREAGITATDGDWLGTSAVRSAKIIDAVLTAAADAARNAAGELDHAPAHASRCSGRPGSVG
jgi:hypothetical protein